jgi:putative Holliday junction resolvase
VTARSTPAGRTCGLDPGKARVGVSMADDLGLLAHPRGALDGHDRKALFESLRKLAEEEGVIRFVVGLPLDMHGGEGSAAREARSFAQGVANVTGREVILWDERLSTVQAKRALDASGRRGRKGQGRIDEAAACAILQAWIDSRRARR